jgi:hypothetical protein
VLILIASVVVALSATFYLSVAPFVRTRVWSATVTPLASIIGSGFLICGPVLAREFGGAAAIAMMVLLSFAYAIGAVIRFNIANAEEMLRADTGSVWIKWTARFAQLTLAVAYSISVAYYLKLLAEFCLHNFKLATGVHDFVAKAAVTGNILIFAVLAGFDGKSRLEHLAHATVSLKIGVIAGMLVALGLYWVLRWGAPVIIPAANVTAGSVPLLLGLLVTVQGFEHLATLAIATTRNCASDQ